MLTKNLSVAGHSELENDRITRRLNEISKELDANMVQRKGSVDQYHKRATDFNAQPRRLNPVTR
jgi:hypothetical protein